MASGTLEFRPGETLKQIVAASAGLSDRDVVRVSLHSPVAAEITTATQLLILPNNATSGDVTLIPFNSTWNYLDDGSNQDIAWRATAFNDGSWLSGPAQLGYGDNDEATPIRPIGSSGTTNITLYFRKTFT